MERTCEEDGGGGDTAGGDGRIAAGDEPRFDDPDDALFYRFCVELLETHHVSDETFRDAYERFGEVALIDTIGVLGNATMLSMCLNTFEVDLPEGVEPAF